jgi:hypothetical protein
MNEEEPFCYTVFSHIYISLTNYCWNDGTKTDRHELAVSLSLSLCPVRKSAGTRTESVFHLCLFDAGTETAGEEGKEEGTPPVVGLCLGR